MSETEMERMAERVAVKVVAEFKRQHSIPPDTHRTHHSWVQRRIDEETDRKRRGLDRRDRIIGGILVVAASSFLLWLGGKAIDFFQNLPQGAP